MSSTSVSTRCQHYVSFGYRYFPDFFLKYDNVQLGNGFSVYEKLIIREQIAFALLPFNINMDIPCQSKTGTLSQVYIKGGCTQSITYPLSAPCKLKENNIETIFFPAVLPLLNTRLFLVALTGSMLLNLRLILQL